MTEPATLQLVDRLRGIYHLPVNDGAGPLNGSMVFSRTYENKDPLQHRAALLIERLQAGEAVEWLEVNTLCMELIEPADPLGMGKLYLVPIRHEAYSEIIRLQTALTS